MIGRDQVSITPLFFFFLPFLPANGRRLGDSNFPTSARGQVEIIGCRAGPVNSRTLLSKALRKVPADSARKWWVVRKHQRAVAFPLSSLPPSPHTSSTFNEPL